MQFGISLVVRGPDAGAETFVALAQQAELLEFDSLWCSAHIILPPQVTSGYAMRPGVHYPPHWNEGYWEPFTVLSYVAAHTKRIRMGTSVLVLPMHNPFEVAKQIAEVDQLSNGRFDFGIGVGWFKEEFEVLGQNFHNRGARTNDALELIRTLWRDEPATYQGKFYQVENGWFSPKPVQKPGPPIWVAGASPAALKRAARFADVWHPVRSTFDDITRDRKAIVPLLEEQGRTADSVRFAVKLPLLFQDGPPSEGQFPTQGRVTDIVDGLKRYRDCGVDHFVFDFVPETRAMASDTMERFANEVKPKLS